MPGHIILLNGAPRAGKSSIAEVIAKTFPGEWQVFGVDAFIKTLPPELCPGIGLRPFVPGDEPAAQTIGPQVPRLYEEFHQSIANLADEGINVVADVGYHDTYAKPLESARRTLPKFLFVGVHCSIEIIMERRNAAREGYAKGSPDNPPEPVIRWQTEVHKDKIYDIEVDTSLLSPTDCANKIRSALLRLPSMVSQ